MAGRCHPAIFSHTDNKEIQASDTRPVMNLRGAFKNDRSEWTSNIRGDCLAGTVSAFAVIPEVIGFTIVAGVDPILGLYTSIAFLIIISFLGGRAAMVSAGAGSMAVVAAPLIASHGLDYLFCAVIIAGLIQIVLGAIGIGHLLKRIPKPIIVGFVDGLAAIIFMSQINSVIENTVDTGLGIALMISYIAVGISVILLFPRVSKAVPSTLVAILVVTIISIIVNMVLGVDDVVMIADLGEMSAGWPTFSMPALITDPTALSVIMPVAISLAFVGLLETSLTLKLVDSMTGTKGSNTRECIAQGVANTACGTMGAMPGCAMIGQAVTNVKSGGRGRLSTLVSGILLALLIAFGSTILGIVPLAALIAVMLYVSYVTFDWSSLRKLLDTKDVAGLKDGAVTVLTFAVIVMTDNLAYGAACGLLLMGMFLVARLLGKKNEPDIA